jgi:prepilin-type N-terminal cleavage/methylation domain-containing protein
MTAHLEHRRPGMTLIELLVVIAILGLLSVVVIPSLSDQTSSRRYREAARNVSAMIARGQSRAIGAPAPRGVILQPLAADPDTVIDLFLANSPEPYAGESSRSSASVTSAGVIQFDDLTTGRFESQPDFCRPDATIQFGSRGARYKFVPPSTLAYADSMQNQGNTPMPRANEMPFKIFRQPTRASGGFLQLTNGAAIDLAWSCLGSRPLRSPDLAPSAWIISDPAKPVTLLFDASGKPMELVHSGGTRTLIGEPLFLLIGEGDLTGNSYNPAVSGEDTGGSPERRQGANWQYGDCAWLCIDNNSGVVKFGAVAPRTTSVLASQQFIRMTIGLGAAER